MICRLAAPTAAAPLLWLTWQKVAHTPTARLSLVYKIVPKNPCFVVRPCGPPKCPEPPGVLAECDLLCSPKCAPGKLERPLGQKLLLERLLAGGILGEQLPLWLERVCNGLPLANRCINFDERHPAAAGQMVDLLA
jgi:hypothetical protein